MVAGVACPYGGQRVEGVRAVFPAERHVFLFRFFWPDFSESGKSLELGILAISSRMAFRAKPSSLCLALSHRVR